jgi:hypothetical protein
MTINNRIRRLHGELKLDDWVILADDDQRVVEELFRQVSAKILAIALEPHTMVDFPVVWSAPDGRGSDGRGGPQVEDPLTLHLSVSEDECVYEFNLRDALQDDLESAAEDGSFVFGLRRLAQELRKFADEIEQGIADAPEE